MPTSDLVFAVVMLTLFALGCLGLAIAARTLARAERRRREADAAGRETTPDRKPPPG